MLSFGKKGEDGRFLSECGEYFVMCTGDIKGKTWMGCKVEPGCKFKLLVRDVDWEDARYACEDDKYRYPCGCVLAVRPDWWKHCPRCGAPLPPPKPYVAPPPKPERKVKEPNRPEWLKMLTAGYERGNTWDCVYEGKSWALVRVPGATSWVSLGSQAYHPTMWTIMRRRGERPGFCIRLEETDTDNIHAIPRYKKEPGEYGQFDVHEGRMNKDKLAKLKRWVDELDERNP